MNRSQKEEGDQTQDLLHALKEDERNPEERPNPQEAKAIGELKINQMEEEGGRGGVKEENDIGASSSEQMENKKYDLSNWKYAELRDTIDTSCDREQLGTKLILNLIFKNILYVF